MKKLLLLGGSRFLLPVIKAAKKLGYHTITCDYLQHRPVYMPYGSISILKKEKL